jgi:ABC-type Fe3+-hydroxamate transport system substrate-binding protein
VSGAVDIQDQLGRRVRLPAPAQRVVSLVPSQTELLFALGAGDRVVGVTDFCTEPEAARRDKVCVGGTKRLRSERVLALEPDLVLANKEENEREVVEALAARCPVWISDIVSLRDATAMIDAVGTLLGVGGAARHMVTDIDQGFAALPAVAPIRAAYLIWRKPWMAAGSDSFIDSMLTEAGFDNVFDDTPRYPETDPEDLLRRRPDVLLLSSEPFPFTEAQAGELSAELGLPCLWVDAMPFSWYGSQLLRAPGYFKALRRRVAEALGSEV